MTYRYQPGMGDAPSSGSGLSTLITLALLGGAGYFAWKILFADIEPKQLGAGTPKKRRGRAEQVKVESQYEEGQEDDLRTAVTLIDHSTLRDLQKQIRKAGFKGADVWGSAGLGGDGFTVGYNGEEYRFAIEEVDA